MVNFENEKELPGGAACPRWSLDSLFASTESDEYKNALADYGAAIDKAESVLEKAAAASAKGGLDWLADVLEILNELSALSQTLDAYTYIVYSVDTTNPKHLTAISKIEEMNLRVTKINNMFNSLVAAHKNELPDFYTRFDEYAFLLEEAAVKAQHQMSAQEEMLAADLQRTGGDAWSRLHEQLISTMADAETGKTFNELRNDAYSACASVRRASYEKEIALLKQNEVALAACLNNLKGETVCLNRRRGWQSAIDRALVSARISRATLDALVAAIEDSLPSWRKYLQAKAGVLNCGGRQGIAFYDLFAPLPDAPQANGFGHNEKNSAQANQSLVSRKWTFAEAKDYIVARYSSFSAAMGSFAERAFDGGWIDAEVRAGKVGGAYDEDFPLGHQSRILTNFTGAFSDVITLAHELGHAYHFSCMKGKPPLFFGYPMTLAETASTFAETIVKQDALASSGGLEKIRLLESDLQDVCQVLVDIVCRFYFERSVFEERACRELSARDFCQLMRDAQERSYGDGLGEERHEYMWAVKSHYYSTSLDFYNFPYAFGQLFAAALYARYKNEGESFVPVYERLLSCTGNMSAEKVCAASGFDITRKEFWQSGIRLYEQAIEEFAGFAESARKC